MINPSIHNYLSPFRFHALKENLRIMSDLYDVLKIPLWTPPQLVIFNIKGSSVDMLRSRVSCFGTAKKGKLEK